MSETPKVLFVLWLVATVGWASFYVINGPKWPVFIAFGVLFAKGYYLGRRP